MTQVFQFFTTSISSLRRLWYSVSLRRFASSIMYQPTDRQEIKIPLSYGYLAAKAWGKETNEPVLALHGWQDNAGTFDRLIPLLSSNLYVVAVDLPGHGRSSKKPIGAFYHYMEMLIDIQKVVNFFKWSSFSMIGHSMGGTLALLYGGVFPALVKNIVLLDVIKPASRDTYKLPNVTAEGINEFIQIEVKLNNPPPVYTKEEARNRLQKAMFENITTEAANVLLVRGSEPSSCGQGVIFTRDIRIKITEDLHKFSHDDLKAYMRRLQSNLLIIVGSDSIIYKSRTPEVLDEFVSIYKESCKSFKLIKVEGNHFVHLNNPERVAPHIDEFFDTQANLTSKM